MFISISTCSFLFPPILASKTLGIVSISSCKISPRSWRVLSGKSPTNEIKSIGKESINDTFQEKYSDYFNTVNKAKRTRQKVIDYLRKCGQFDCISSSGQK